MTSPARVGFCASPNFRDFYERVGECYPEEQSVYATLRGERRRAFVVQKLRTLHGRLLDLGCNRGMYVSLYENGPVVGVDIAHTVLRVARQRCAGASFVQGDAATLTFFRPASFDAVLCSEVLEHVLEPERVLTGCYRVLRPSGRLLLTTPNYRKRRPAWVPVGPLRRYGVAGAKGERYYHTAFRPEELRALAVEAGFDILEAGTLEKEVKYATRLPVLWYRGIRLLNRLLNSEAIERFNEAQLEWCSQRIYRLARRLGIDGVLQGLVGEGVRSFLLAIKPE